MASDQAPGRGTPLQPANRFERIAVELAPEWLEEQQRLRDAGEDADPLVPRTEYFRDSSRSVIATNDSPDIPFAASLNPYRGCEHGCIYCYARPTHEYLGLSAGLDFETRIFVKEEAPALLRAELAKASWTPQVLAMSGVTDPYQPVERALGLTRQCLEVLAEFRNPVGVITKNQLVTRDIDVLAELAGDGCADVALSITTLDESLRRLLEPRTSRADLRLDAIAKLNAAGIPAGVMVAPVIPGLNDHEIPAILQRAADAGRALCRLRDAAPAARREDAVRGVARAALPGPQDPRDGPHHGRARREPERSPLRLPHARRGSDCGAHCGALRHRARPRRHPAPRPRAPHGCVSQEGTGPVVLGLSKVQGTRDEGRGSSDCPMFKGQRTRDEGWCP